MDVILMDLLHTEILLRFILLSNVIVEFPLNRITLLQKSSYFAYPKLILHNQSHGHSQRKKINIIAIADVHGVTGDFFVQVANG